MKTSNYVGRFAPSPTGPLHYGSLLAATASYLQAKSHQGKWLVRIENIDPPREIKDAATNILSTLEWFQFEWDEKPLYQSTRFEYYRSICDELVAQEHVYACSCSRKKIAENAQKTALGRRYPGTCANKKLPTNNITFNLRLRVSEQPISYQDLHYGLQNHNLLSEIGDIIIYRKENLPSYSLAVVLDDAMQGITEVVRGIDLLPFTPVQIHLCKLLKFSIPKFLHIPIIVNQQGQKLSKQSYAPAITHHNCAKTLVQVLNDLGQQIPEELAKDSLTDIWNWAIKHWDRKKIPRAKEIIYLK